MCKILQPYHNVSLRWLQITFEVYKTQTLTFVAILFHAFWVGQWVTWTSSIRK